MIDDSDVNLALYRSALATLENVEFVPFTSSREALDWSKLAVPYLVICDYSMPPPDGIEFRAPR